jgi:nicotinamide riboside kinase
VLFCDTDSFATTVWHERYIGGRNPLVEETADRVAHDLWLLTDHEGVAFEDDGLRDGEELRPWMTDRFRAELTRTGRRFIELTGPHRHRMDTAVDAVDTLLAAGWDFAAPLPERR